ncbi:MAG: efflux RND transporter permease subunit [Deltaproteobacteria bacterium]|nr:efflux RND transporter permease subunit [Deltaproteobacteria bacterium]
MQWLAGVSVRRPVFASVLMLGIIVLGLAGYSQLGVDRFPKVEFPWVSISTRLPGAGPSEMETEVTDKIEEAINTIAGIEELRSVSSEGNSQIWVSFVMDKSVDVASQEVRDRVTQAMPLLPRGIDPPVVMKLDPGATPVAYIAVKSNGLAPRELTEVVDKTIRRQLETVSGVGQVSMLGGRKRQVNIWLDPVKMRGLGLTAVDVQRALATQNLILPAGSLEAGGASQTLRIRGRVSNPAGLADLVVRQTQERPIRLADVARVDDGEEKGETYASQDGVRGVMLSVRKQSDANTVAVVDALKERIADMAPTLPSGMSLEMVRDNSRTIRTSVSAVGEHLVLGALFAALTVLLFLGELRSTVIAAVAIPVSLVGTFAVMWVQGFTLDTITLLALALSVGIVIDDAIVVLENIHRYVYEKQVAPREAAIMATKEIGLAVLATTMSLLAVFVPVAFMSGIVGRFLKSFGLTMAAAIAISMFVSFSLTPLLSSRWLKAVRPVGSGPDGRAHRKPVLERMVDSIYGPIERLYMRVLAWAMRHRWVVVVACVASLVAVPPLMGKVKKGFLPDSDEAHFEVNIRAPEGSNLQATALIAERIARDVRQLPGVLGTVVTVGDSVFRSANLGAVYVRLVDPNQRKQDQNQMMERVRREVLAKLPKDLVVDVSLVPLFSGGFAEALVNYEITGTDLAKLQEYSDHMLKEMKAIPGAVDVKSSLVGGKPEVTLQIDRDRAADLGVSVADVATTLQLLMGDIKASTYEENGQSYEIHTRAERTYRLDESALSLITVPSVRLGAVPLTDVVVVDKATGPAQINRLNRRRQVVLSANVAPGFAEGTILDGVKTAVAGLNLPKGYSAGPVGRSKEMAKAGKAFLLAFVLSIVFMYLVLAAQFESWLHPVTILMALPLTLPFALVSLVMLGQSLNIQSMLGILVLFAVVKKNAILQIDHTNNLRAEGMERLAAILQANKDRLRPILMTTLAFVAGMIPLATAKGIGAGFNQATAGVIVGGQVLSLLLTLLATPVTYSLLDDARGLFGRIGQRVAKRVRGVSMPMGLGAKDAA